MVENPSLSFPPTRSKPELTVLLTVDRPLPMVLNPSERPELMVLKPLERPEFIVLNPLDIPLVKEVLTEFIESLKAMVEASILPVTSEKPDDSWVPIVDVIEDDRPLTVLDREESEPEILFRPLLTVENPVPRDEATVEKPAFKSID